MAWWSNERRCDAHSNVHLESVSLRCLVWDDVSGGVEWRMTKKKRDFMTLWYHLPNGIVEWSERVYTLREAVWVERRRRRLSWCVSCHHSFSIPQWCSFRRRLPKAGRRSSSLTRNFRDWTKYIYIYISEKSNVVIQWMEAWRQFPASIDCKMCLEFQKKVYRKNETHRM